MSDLVPGGDIERIVGVPRAAKQHYARAVSAEQTVYILHSRECLDSGRDLRLCPFSLALDNGIRTDEWVEDFPVAIRIEGAFEQTRLVPEASPPEHVMAWLHETYKSEGVEIWLAAWRNADPERRAFLERLADMDGNG